MAKKNAKKKLTPSGPHRESPAAPAAAPETGAPAAGGRLFWILAAVFIVSGYALLTKADPGGRNGWSVAAPALLLAGYLLIIPAITRTYRR